MRHQKRRWLLEREVEPEIPSSTFGARVKNQEDVRIISKLSSFMCLSLSPPKPWSGILPCLKSQAILPGFPYPGAHFQQPLVYYPLI